MSDDKYLVAFYEPLQVVPCIGSGLRATFHGEDGSISHTAPVVAMAICRVRQDWYRNGRLLTKGDSERQVCGVLTYAEDGFAICEESSNFAGYLQPGEELSSGTNTDVSTDQESRK